MSGPYIQRILKEPRSPLATDIFVFQTVDVSKPSNLEIPSFGTPYDSLGPVKKSYPNHKFCWREGPDRNGNYTDVFIADLVTQHLYNWEIDNEPQWPVINQVFVIPRATYVADPTDPETTYPPPPGDKVDLTGYEITALREVRSGSERLDSLYVVVQVQREKIDSPLTWQEFDQDTGQIRTFERQKVPAGTAGSTTNDSGTFTETTPFNQFWSILDTKQAAGLAGGAVDGVSSRTWNFIQDYYWPPVLDYIFIQAILEDPSDSTSDLQGYVTANIWRVDQYNGPCNATMVETWYKDPPPLIEPDVLLPTEIDFQGGDLRVYVPRSLHGFIRIFDSGVSQDFFATTPQFWPATIIASVDVTPQWGGWLQRVVTIDAPAVQGVTPGIVLTVSDQTVDGFTLSWTPQSPAVDETTVNIAQSPEFDTGFLPGYQGLEVAAGTNTLVVTGAQQGRYYYAQVTRNGVTSNIVVCGADPSAILQVELNGIVLVSGSTVNAGSTAPGQSVETTFTLRNTGSQILTNIVVTVTGDDEDQFSLGNLPTALNPGQTGSVTVTFTPSSGGTKTALFSIYYDGEGASPFLLTLSGEAIAPALQLEEPLNTTIPEGGTISFGSFTTTPVTKTVYIRNTGAGDAEGITASLTGTNVADFSVTSAPASTLASGDVLPFEVTFNPSADQSSSSNREVTLSVASNDPDTPYTVTLAGIYDPPEAPGSLDPTFNVVINGPVYAIAVDTDGAMYIGGSFNAVNGSPVVNLVKLTSAGVVDGTFACDPNGDVRALAIEEDGNLLVGGLFTEIGVGSPDSILYLARVSATGTVDATFTPTPSDYVACLAIQDDGKIIVGGDFATIGGGAPAFLARVNTDGTVDGTFSSEVNGVVNAVVILENGDLVIGGGWEGTDTPTTLPATTTGPTTTPTPPTEPPITTTVPPVTTTAPPVTTTETPPTDPPATTTTPP